MIERPSESSSLTGRERVLMALDHQEPDRVPIMLGVSNATGLKMNPYKAIKAELGIEAPDEYLYGWPELGTACIDEATMQHLRSDVRGVLDLEPSETLARNRARPAHTDYIDSWGSGASEIKPGQWFPMVHPLAAATTIEEIEAHPWPDMDDPTRIAHAAQQAQQLAADNQFAIVATPWLLFPLERAFAMQGMDTFLMNMALYPEFAEALLWKLQAVCKQLMGNFLNELGPNVDIIKIGDDLGTQQSLLMSPDMYRQVLKPIHADWIEFIKARTDAKLMFHTDGDVFPLIDEFVEMGIDILNPIQTSAGKMSDLQALRDRYGSKIVFCGAIDTQHVLPHGTPAEVKAEVSRVIDILGPGGGYMLASVHTVMDDVPAENILAMVDAVVEHGRATTR